MQKEKQGKKRRGYKSRQVTVWLPEEVVKALDYRAVAEDCSRSWLLTEFACIGLGLDEKVIADSRGYDIPKTRSERRNTNWTPNKKGKKDRKPEFTDTTISRRIAAGWLDLSRAEVEQMSLDELNRRLDEVGCPQKVIE